MAGKILLSIVGAAAGAVNGLFGAGGGLVLVPMLGKKVGLSENERFPASIAIIAPVCVTSLLVSRQWELSFRELTMTNKAIGNLKFHIISFLLIKMEL